MRQACFVFLLVLSMSRLSFGQTWDEARATMAENIRICEMILANPGKYPGINISTISTFHYYYMNVTTVQTNLSVLNSINAGVAAAIQGYSFPPAVSVNIVPLDYTSVVNQILGRVQIALLAAIVCGKFSLIRLKRALSDVPSTFAFRPALLGLLTVGVVSVECVIDSFD